MQNIVSQWNDLKPFETMEKKPLDNVHFKEFVCRLPSFSMHTYVNHTIESINT